MKLYSVLPTSTTPFVRFPTSFMKSFCTNPVIQPRTCSIAESTYARTASFVLARYGVSHVSMPVT